MSKSKYGDLFQNPEYSKLQKDDAAQTRGVYVPEPYDTYAIDLIFIPTTAGRYAIYLNAIDVFTRKVASVKLSSKTTPEIIRGVIQVFEMLGGKPKRIWSDLEGGIESNAFKKFAEGHHIEVYQTFGKVHNPVIERFNRTQKELVERIKFKGSLDEKIKIVNEHYNKSKHRTLGMAPNDAYNKVNKVENIHRDNYNEPRKEFSDDIKINDKVKVRKEKETFDKGYINQFVNKIYYISAIYNTNPKTYRVKDKIDDTEQYRELIYRYEILKV